MAEEDRAPNLLPIALILGVLLWTVATTGGHELFVKEVLGDVYDSQAEHFLRGDVGVDAAASRWETIIVNGKPRIYFASFRLRAMPLNSLYLAEGSVVDSVVLRGNCRAGCITGLLEWRCDLPIQCLAELGGKACLIGLVARLSCF
jgi:hypothetical protein